MGMIEVKGENIIIDVIEFLKNEEVTGVSFAAEVRRHLAAKAGSIAELRTILADKVDSDFPRILKMEDVDTAELQELAASAPELIEKVDAFEQAMDDLENKFTALEVYPVYLREGHSSELDFVDFSKIFVLALNTQGKHSNLSKLTELLNTF